MFSWSVPAPVEPFTYFASDIVLFTIDPKTGYITNTKKDIADFPVNENYLMTTIDHMNSEGTALYTVDSYAGPGAYPVQYPIFYSSAINAKTGLLSKRKLLWYNDDSDKSNENAGGDSTVLGDSILAWNPLSPAGTYNLDVYSMGANPAPLVKCPAAMLALCGESLVGSVYIHPSQKYLFIYDPSTLETSVVYVSTAKKKLEASGAFIPPTDNMARIFFSPDGLMVYAVEATPENSLEISIYVFDPHTGLFTAHSSIPVANQYAVLPYSN